MPSLKSNKNKWALPVYPPPVESVCIPVNVPNDPQWIGLFLGAIYRLSQQIHYDRDAAHTAKDVAAIWQQIYLDTVNRSWDCSDMTGCICTVRYNPATGRLEASDDGFTFYEVPDGPWVDSPIRYPEPRVNPAPTEFERKCNAAYAAAIVLQALYRETWDVFLGWANRGAFLIAREFADMASDILGAFGLVDEYINIAEDLHAQESSFVDGGFPDSELANVTCILFDNATDTDGVITFDFAGVVSGFGAESGSPYPGLNFLLQLYIGEDGLNVAGNIDAGDGDCSECGTWCYWQNFGVGYTGWTLLGSTTWVASEGVAGVYYSPTSQSDAFMQRSFTPFTPTRIGFSIAKTGGSGANNIIYFVAKRAGVTVATYSIAGGVGNTFHWLDVGAEIDYVYIDVNSGATNGNVRIQEFQAEGDGSDPFEGAGPCP